MNNKNLFSFYVLLGISVFLIVAGVILYQYKGDGVKPESTFDLSSTRVASSSASQEPDVTSWKNYNNDQYNFTFDFPAGWHQQEYDQPELKGGLFVAFSPDSLPCKTCTYFRSGYFSVKVYNQKTDSESYTAFQQRMANGGKSVDYQLVSLGKAKGVIFANTIAIANQDFVYELSLDTNGGNTKVADSKIFQKVLSTFKFTGLSFN